MMFSPVLTAASHSHHSLTGTHWFPFPRHTVLVISHPPHHSHYFSLALLLTHHITHTATVKISLMLKNNSPVSPKPQRLFK